MEPKRVEWLVYVNGDLKCICRDEDEVKVACWARRGVDIRIMKRIEYPNGGSTTMRVKEIQ